MQIVARLVIRDGAAQGLEHSRLKPTVTRHTPTDEMPRYKAVVRFQARRAGCSMYYG